MAILDPQENYNPKLGLQIIYRKLVEIIGNLNTAITNIATNTAAIEAMGTTPKIYKALLTQTTVTSTSGLLVVGKTYVIGTLQAGDNFANVGYVSDGTNFVATGTTPTTWTNSTSVLNVTDSAPVATVLVNTLSGTPVWSYVNVGIYKLTLASEWSASKTALNPINIPDGTGFGSLQRVDTNDVYLYTQDTSHVNSNDLLVESLVTIEVYP